MSDTVGIYDLDREDLATALAGEPGWRVDQLWQGLYRDLSPLGEITTLPAAMRDALGRTHPESLVASHRKESDRGTTVKFLWNLTDGLHPIETVLMHYRDRSTVCVSTQAGCAMACGFCATGQAGFTRHLTTGEIVEQVVRAARVAAETNRRVDNVVLMGMGEPLANEPEVHRAVTRIHSALGISARSITVSTVGIVPGIRRMAEWDLPVNLAVSVHAGRDELRDELVPINRRYPLAELIEACRDYLAVKRRRVTFEWALIDSVNDTDRDARELAALTRALRPAAHVNLIPLNPTPGWPTVGSPPARVTAFRDKVAVANPRYLSGD